MPLEGGRCVYIFNYKGGGFKVKKKRVFALPRPAPGAQKNRGAGHGAPENDSVHWSALLFPGFQTCKQKFFHVHRAFYLENPFVQAL